MTLKQCIYYLLAAMNGGPGVFYLLTGQWLRASIGIGVGCIFVWIADLQNQEP